MFIRDGATEAAVPFAAAARRAAELPPGRGRAVVESLFGAALSWPCHVERGDITAPIVSG
jgi:hypothetical protein